MESEKRSTKNKYINTILSLTKGKYQLIVYQGLKTQKSLFAERERKNVERKSLLKMDRININFPNEFSVYVWEYNRSFLAEKKGIECWECANFI